MSTPETPRTWKIGGWHDCPVIVGPALRGRTVEMVEKAPVDAERERLLDVIERLEDEVGIDEDGMPWPSAFDAVNLLREYGRLGKEES